MIYLLGLVPLIFFLGVIAVFFWLSVREGRFWYCPRCSQRNHQLSCVKCGQAIDYQPAYAGFVKRFCASWIDGLILFIVAIPFRIIYYKNDAAMTIVQSILTLFFVVAVWICLSLWGKTPGKYFTGIEVRKINSDKISWRSAFLRQLVQYLIVLTGLIIFAISFVSSGQQPITSYGDDQVSNPSLGSSILWMVGSFWVLIELIVLLTNKEKRTLHDFIAGTVVVDSKTLPKEG